MKARRHGLILSIIKEKSIETQEALDGAESRRVEVTRLPFRGTSKNWV